MICADCTSYFWMLVCRWSNNTETCCHNKILIFIQCCCVFTVSLKHFVLLEVTVPDDITRNHETDPQVCQTDEFTPLFHVFFFSDPIYYFRPTFPFQVSVIIFYINLSYTLWLIQTLAPNICHLFSQMLPDSVRITKISGFQK